jgi:hypothetical protein
MQYTNGVHVRNETLNDKEKKEQKLQNDKAYALILPQAESVPSGLVNSGTKEPETVSSCGGNSTSKQRRL